MKHAAWAIEPSYFDAAIAQDLRPNPDAKPMAFALFGTEALIGVSGLLTPTPVLAVTPAGPMPIGTSYLQMAVALDEAGTDDRVESVRILMNSGGGMVDGVRRAMAALRDCPKPTVVQVDGSCCSAAYWFASAADRIVAQSTASIGCLGVMLPKKNLPKGERRFISSQTPDKVPDPHSDAGEQYQRIVDDFAGQLLDDVAANRGRDRKTVASDFGKGATLPARAALAAGLIDAIVGPSIGANRPDASQAYEESQTPARREKEAPMERPDLGELSREEEDAVLALRAAAMEDEDEEMAVDESVDDEKSKDLIKPKVDDDQAAAVARDIRAVALSSENHALKSQLAVMQLHVQGAQAAERTSRIDALILSGRIGTTDTDRNLAALAFDAEQSAIQGYALTKGVALAVAAQAQSGCRLFSELEGKAAGAANAGLKGSSVGGAPFSGQLDASLATGAGFENYINEYVKANAGASTAMAISEFRTKHSAEYAEVMKGAN